MRKITAQKKRKKTQSICATFPSSARSVCPGGPATRPRRSCHRWRRYTSEPGFFYLVQFFLFLSLFLDQNIPKQCFWVHLEECTKSKLRLVSPFFLSTVFDPPTHILQPPPRVCFGHSRSHSCPSLAPHPRHSPCRTRRGHTPPTTAPAPPSRRRPAASPG